MTFTNAPPDDISALSIRSLISSSRSAHNLRRSARSPQEKYSYCPGSAKYVTGPIATGAHAISGSTSALPNATMNALCSIMGHPLLCQATTIHFDVSRRVTKEQAAAGHRDEAYQIAASAG